MLDPSGTDVFPLRAPRKSSRDDLRECPSWRCFAATARASATGPLRLAVAWRFARSSASSVALCAFSLSASLLPAFLMRTASFTKVLNAARSFLIADKAADNICARSFNRIWVCSEEPNKSTIVSVIVGACNAPRTMLSAQRTARKIIARHVSNQKPKILKLDHDK